MKLLWILIRFPLFIVLGVIVVSILKYNTILLLLLLLSLVVFVVNKLYQRFKTE